MGNSFDKHQQAMALVNGGLIAQEEGELDKALELYRQSLEVYPTPEGHTYLGWALSYQGNFDEAIAHCREALELDPEFGNPYNDIGVYLMQQKQFDAAIPWFELAKRARRYEPRHYPYINLGHIYAARGELKRALEEFKAALEIVPDDERLKAIVAALETKLN